MSTSGPRRFGFALLLLGSLAGAHAQSESVELDSKHTQPQWNTDQKYWERILEQPKPDGVKLGKSDFVVRGPLVDGVRRQRSPGPRSLGKRLLGLPVVRLLVPQRIPAPPGGGRYFAWGERDQSWSSFSAAAAPLGNTDNPIWKEPKTALISVGLKKEK
jgi:hypothetical protein